jgi:hypothetical membrane protein
MYVPIHFELAIVIFNVVLLGVGLVSMIMACSLTKDGFADRSIEFIQVDDLEATLIGGCYNGNTV